MATLHAAADGTILRWLANQREEAQYPDPPTGTVTTLGFDASSNRPLANDLTLSLLSYNLTAAGLTKNGTPVVIAAPSTSSRRQMIDDLVAMQATIQAATTVNNLKNVCQDLRRMLLTIVRTVSLPEE